MRAHRPPVPKPEDAPRAGAAGTLPGPARAPSAVGEMLSESRSSAGAGSRAAASARRGSRRARQSRAGAARSPSLRQAPWAALPRATRSRTPPPSPQARCRRAKGEPCAPLWRARAKLRVRIVQSRTLECPPSGHDLRLALRARDERFASSICRARLPVCDFSAGLARAMSLK